MNAAIVFGLLAAVLYGLNNFVARFANRSNGVTATLFWSQWLLAAITGAVWFWQAMPSSAEVRSWGVLIGYSLVITAATGCLYLGLARGRISVVVPLMATYGAVSAICSWLSGETLNGAVAGCIALVVAGAVLSAMPSQQSQRDRASGWLPAVAASGLFGIGYWVQGEYVLPAFGVISTLWVYNLIAALAVSMWVLTHQKSVRPESLSDFRLIVLTGLLGGGGFAALSLAQSNGDVAIATALSSTSTAVAVVLAFVFLREKPGLKSGIGIAAVVGGIMGLHIVA